METQEGYSASECISSCVEKEDPEISIIAEVSSKASTSLTELVKKLPYSSPSSSPSPTQPTNKDDTDTSSSESMESVFSSGTTSSHGNTWTTKYTNSAGSNSNATYLGGKDSDDQKVDDRHKAVFDKVVLDALQRKHIREKHFRSKDKERSYVTSDSSSGAAEGEATLVLSQHGFEPGAKYRFRPQEAAEGETNSDTGISSWQGEPPSFVNISPTYLQASTSSGRHRQKQGPLSIYYNSLKRPSSSQQDLWSNLPPTGSSNLGSDGERGRKRKRFYRTFTTLRQCGLMEITMQTASLMEQNRKLQEQIEVLKTETATTYSQMLQLAKSNPTFLTQDNAAEMMENLRQIVAGKEALQSQDDRTLGVTQSCNDVQGSNHERIDV